MRVIVYVLLFGVMACMLALEQYALIGSGVGAWWVWTQLTQITLGYITGSSRREQRMGRRQHPGVARRAGRGHRLERRPLQAGRGRVVPEA